MSETAWRAREIIDLCRSLRVRIVSFDFFDTLVFRTAPGHKDVYALAAARLPSGSVPPELTPASFREVRWRAEQRVAARRSQASTRYSLTLSEIYEELSNDVPWQLSPEALIANEIEADAQIQIANEHASELMTKLREAGLRIIVVSNTPYSSTTLEQFLQRLRWPASAMPDRIYASSEHDASKQNGLFELVVATERCAPNEILHIGDNPVTDDRAARSAGLQVQPYHIATLFGAEFASCRKRERDLLKQDPMRAHIPLGLVDAARMDAWNALAEETRKHGPYDNYGAFAVGPVITPFIQWVCAQRQPGERLVYLEREGIFLHQCATAAGLVDESCDVVLPCSRFSLFRAVIDQLDPEEIVSFLLRMNKGGWRPILATLGLTQDDVRSNFGIDLELVPLTSDNLGRIVETVFESPDRFQRLTDRCARRRSAIRTLLGIEDVASLAVVDLGYKGTIQRFLALCLRSLNLNVRLRGLYLATLPDAFFSSAASGEMRGYVTDFGVSPDLAALVQRNVALLEQCLMPPLGSVEDLDEHQVYRASVGIPSAQLDAQHAVQRGALAYTRAYVRLHALVKPDPALVRLAAVTVLERVLRGSRLEQDLFSEWVHEVNLGSQSTIPVLPRKSRSERLLGIGRSIRVERFLKTSRSGRKLLKLARDPYRFWLDSQARRWVGQLRLR